MRVVVAERAGAADPFEIDCPGASPGCPWETVLYMPLPRHTQVGSLDARLKSFQAQLRRIAEAVVFRMHAPEAAELLENERTTDALRRRFEGRPIFLAHLVEDGQFRITPLGDFDADLDAGQMMEALRFAEMRAMLSHPGVVLPPNDDFHYQGPNGHHYESFIRVGVALRSIAVLDAISFWVQPHLAGRTLVVLDSPTMMALGLNLERYAAQSGFARPEILAIECQHAYDEKDAGLADRLAALVRAHGTDLSALILTSVVSSGDLNRSLSKLVTEVGVEDVRAVGLYGSEVAPGEVLCRPPQLGQHWPAENCPIKTSAIPIGRSTYLLELSTTPSKARITKPHAERAFEFFKRYRGARCVAVHREQHDRDRHHMIHIDASRLITTKAFKERLGAKVAEVGEVDILLAPDHKVAVELARQIEGMLDVPLVIADETQLPGLDGAERAALAGARRILLVDDVVITGTRIRGYRHFLRSCEFSKPDSEVHMIVGVARPADNTHLRGIAEMTDHFHPVETLLLPNWEESDCPWCWESEILARAAPSLPASQQIASRIETLEDRKHGLQHGLYLPWSAGGDRLPVGTWELGPGSIFDAETEAEMFAVVASSVQSLRAAGDLSDRLTHPLAKILNADLWLDGRFYDPVITAAILRATRRHDLRNASDDLQLTKRLQGRLTEPASRQLRGELILAVARDRLPTPPGLLEEGGALTDPSADRAVKKMLSEALAAPL
jgi:hypothetical protein